MDSEVVRGKPLSKDETKSLLGLVESSKIILSKTTNATNNKLKTEEWLRITNRFNATATVHRRTPQQLRLKWENLKKNARKRCTKIRLNRIQTGGGPSEYIPPDDVLDRVAALLGSTATGFVVPFGGDREPLLCYGGYDGDSSGEGPIGGQAGVLPLDYDTGGSLLMSIDTGMSTSIPVSTDTGMSTSIPVSIDTGIEISIPVSNDNGTGTSIPADSNEVSGCALTVGASPVITLPTPHRLTFGAPRKGKKKLQAADEGKTARNLAIAEYYSIKKQNVLLQNEKLKLENAKLKIELDNLPNKG